MKFTGQKRMILVDEKYSQIAELEKFWNEMRGLLPNDFLYGLGANMDSGPIDYYIGKIDDYWDGGSEAIEIPDDGWVEFSCNQTDEDIEKMYRGIFKKGQPDYEIESMKDGIFTTKVHFAN